MIQTVRITSKNQITIPADFVRALNLKKGDEISVSLDIEDKKLTIKNPKDILNSLRGSIEVPSHLKGRDLDKVIKEAKHIHFSKKYGKPLR